MHSSSAYRNKLSGLQVLAGLFLLIASHNLYAEAGISINTTEKPAAASANVKFVIHVPYQLEMKAGPGNLTLHSNTGNLLVTHQQSKRADFISTPDLINTSYSNQGHYTIASP